MSTDVRDSSKDVVRRLREKWEKNTRRRKQLTATFDELVDMFIRRGMSNRAVAKIYHMAIEPVRLCRMRYIEPILGQTGHEQYVARRRECHDDKLRELPKDPVLRPIAIAAEEAGLTVRRVYSRGASKGARSRALFINDHLCSIHVPRHRDKRSEAHRQKYVEFAFQREIVKYEQPAVRIFFVPIAEGKNRIFVVPAFVFNRRRTKSKRIAGHILLEPRKRALYIPGQLDWSKYENWIPLE